MNITDFDRFTLELMLTLIKNCFWQYCIIIDSDSYTLELKLTFMPYNWICSCTLDLILTVLSYITDQQIPLHWFRKVYSFNVNNVCAHFCLSFVFFYSWQIIFYFLSLMLCIIYLFLSSYGNCLVYFLLKLNFRIIQCIHSKVNF